MRRIQSFNNEVWIEVRTLSRCGMCPYARRKVVAYSLSQLRKRELDYPTYYVELSIVEHGSAIFSGVNVTSKWITRI